MGSSRLNTRLRQRARSVTLKSPFDAVKRAAETASPNNRRAQVAIQRAVLRVFRDPSADESKAIYWLCQTYFLLGAYTIDPEGSILSKALFTGVRLWLDSNVILPV